MTKEFRKYWLPVIVWAALIFSVSSISRFPKEVQPIFSVDGIPHALEYAVFGFLLARAFKNEDNREILRNNFRLLAVLAAVLYGASDEFHQYFVPMRTASAVDLIYDGIGSCIGQLFCKNKI
ncbi:MAG: VanZ family protein [Candidatus Omnitrophica bacterium]|nr:VanZ family protein [Candidatus Omnitrophota bacterium]